MSRPAFPLVPKLQNRLTDAATAWRRVSLTDWYGNQTRILDIASDVAVWYRSGAPPITVRWVLMRDPTGEHEPQAFFSTDRTGGNPGLLRPPLAG